LIRNLDSSKEPVQGMSVGAVYDRAVIDRAYK